MKKAIMISAIFNCLVLPACITTLHPLVTYDKIITDERLIGNWKSDKGEFSIQQFFKSGLFKQHKEEIEKDIIKKERSGKRKGDSILYSNSYLIEYIKDGIQYDLLGILTRLDGQLFINLSTLNAKSVNDTARDSSVDPGSSIGTCTIAKVQVLNLNTLEIDFLDGGFIYDQVKAGRLKIKNERDDLYDTFLITASTPEIRQFLEKYGSDNRLYNKGNSFTLTRKS